MFTSIDRHVLNHLERNRDQVVPCTLKAKKKKKEKKERGMCSVDRVHFGLPGSNGWPGNAITVTGMASCPPDRISHLRLYWHHGARNCHLRLYWHHPLFIYFSDVTGTVDD